MGNHTAKASLPELPETAIDRVLISIRAKIAGDERDLQEYHVLEAKVPNWVTPSATDKLSDTFAKLVAKNETTPLSFVKRSTFAKYREC